MKHYDSKNLFIGEIGHTHKTQKNGNSYITIEKNGLAITFQKKCEQDYYYFDALSDKKYIDFHNYFCSAGDIAIYKPVQLLTYIQQIYNDTKEIDLISKITTKIINGKSISIKEITTLLYYLNNKEAFIKNIKTEKNNNTSNTPDFILTNKQFKWQPSTGNDNELKELIFSLAQDKKNSIIIGEGGVGKTTLVNELAYRIQKNMVPNFLKGKKIIDITPFISNSKYTDELNNIIKDLIDGIIKNKYIIFIENIHSIFSIDNYLSNIIRQELQNQNLKIIGTTNLQNYYKYIEDNNLDKHCKKIHLLEPNDEMLYKIIEFNFSNYSKKNNISLLDNIDSIINYLIELTKIENRITNDNLYNDCSKDVNNPELVIEIIDNIFASAKVNDQKKLNANDIIYGIKSCDKIKNEIKEQIIEKLKNKKTHFKQLFIKKQAN